MYSDPPPPFKIVRLEALATSRPSAACRTIAFQRMCIFSLPLRFVPIDNTPFSFAPSPIDVGFKNKRSSQQFLLSLFQFSKSLSPVSHGRPTRAERVLFTPSSPSYKSILSLHAPVSPRSIRQTPRISDPAIGHLPRFFLVHKFDSQIRSSLVLYVQLHRRKSRNA